MDDSFRSLRGTRVALPGVRRDAPRLVIQVTVERMWGQARSWQANGVAADRVLVWTSGCLVEAKAELADAALADGGHQRGVSVPMAPMRASDEPLQRPLGKRSVGPQRPHEGANLGLEMRGRGPRRFGNGHGVVLPAGSRPLGRTVSVTTAQLAGGCGRAAAAPPSRATSGRRCAEALRREPGPRGPLTRSGVACRRGWPGTRG